LVPAKLQLLTLEIYDNLNYNIMASDKICGYNSNCEHNQLPQGPQHTFQ